MSKFPMTIQGAELLQQELHRLKFVERPKISKAIGEARAMGDLRENAEYHAAREMQSFAEGRIQEIESKLANALIVDVSKIENTGKVVFGTTIHLSNLETEEKVSYQIVGEDEADIKALKISVSSPVARALIGKEIGDTIDVATPSGYIQYEITEVEYI